MESFSLVELLEKTVEQGFLLVSISIATQITVKELESILCEGKVKKITDKIKYLLVFLMQLNYEKPIDDMYYLLMICIIENYLIFF